MRVLTVSDMKRERRPGRRKSYPAPSSQAGKILEVLRRDEGRVVSLEGTASFNRTVNINHLTDFYGCDIRKAAGRNNYILAGEWFGSHYVDYVDRAINAAIRKGAV